MVRKANLLVKGLQVSGDAGVDHGQPPSSSFRSYLNEVQSFASRRSPLISSKPFLDPDHLP
jgi:hypothetical protein